MNDIGLIQLEKVREELLKKYGLDEDSIRDFKTKIKNVNVEEGNRLGKELLETILKKNFNDQYEKALALIYQGANVEFKNSTKGAFPLLVCSRRNYLQTFIVLLKAGANVNQTNHYLTTSTMASARHGNKEILAILIAMRADVNARCLDGDTAIMSAKRNNQVECFHMLKNAHAYFNNTNLFNQTALDLSSSASFDLTDVPTFGNNTVSFQDIQELLLEANEKLDQVREFMLMKKK